MDLIDKDDKDIEADYGEKETLILVFDNVPENDTAIVLDKSKKHSGDEVG